MLAVAVALIISLVLQSLLAFKQFGFFRFLSSAEWNPTAGSEQYGALTFIVAGGSVHGRILQGAACGADRFLAYGSAGGNTLYCIRIMGLLYIAADY